MVSFYLVWHNSSAITFASLLSKLVIGLFKIYSTFLSELLWITVKWITRRFFSVYQKMSFSFQIRLKNCLTAQKDTSSRKHFWKYYFTLIACPVVTSFPSFFVDSNHFLQKPFLEHPSLSGSETFFMCNCFNNIKNT